MQFKREYLIEIILRETVKMYFYLKKKILLAVTLEVLKKVQMKKAMPNYLINLNKKSQAKKIKIQKLINLKRDQLKFQVKKATINPIAIRIVNPISKTSKYYYLNHYSNLNRKNSSKKSPEK